MAENDSNGPGPDGELLEDVEQELKEPEMYMVILHNDHYTTMEFVVAVLTEVFQKSTPEATKIMLDVHKKGRGHVGAYPFDIAASKVAKVRHLAKQAEFPLQCTMEQL
jgi:ATP-dependent Clp protease adaptor protein ClpS